MKGISIIVPIFNESKNISTLYSKLKKIKIRTKKEIIFVDDNSNDGSQIILNNLKKKIRYILRKEKKRDLMQSCFLGIKKSKFDTCIIMDGDLQHNPKYINGLYNKFKKNFDLGICVRNFKIIKKEELSYFRKLMSLLIIFIINLILKKKTIDPLSGFFIFKKKIFFENRIKYYQKGYKILLNILYCNKRKLKTFDKIIKFDSRSKDKSKLNLIVLIHLIFQIFFIFKNNLLNKFLGSEKL